MDGAGRDGPRLAGVALLAARKLLRNLEFCHAMKLMIFERFAPGRWGLWCLVTATILVQGAASAGGGGTLVILQNPTNSSPRVISLWGGAGSEQIIMKSDGTVWDWGFNRDGGLGNGTTNNADLPLQVLGPNGTGYLTDLAAIMGGELHNFALKQDGTVWAWGMNYFGQLGDGSADWGYLTDMSTTPVQVSGLTSVVGLGGRGYHSMALKAEGTVWTWGCNRDGELGIGVAYDSGGNGIDQGTNVPVQVVGLTNPASISGGGFFSLALMSNGTVWAWGEGDHGECGTGANLNCPSPVPVSGLSNIVAVSGGWFHALALRADGTVWAWGDNSAGELGDGTTTNRNTPVQVVGLSNMVSVSTGDDNSMARRADGTIWKWGENDYGELGIGTADTNAHPLAGQVPGLSNVVISANRDYHNICARRDGTVWVWGDNRYGGGGDFTGNNVLSPRLMPGLVSNNLLPYAESFEGYAAGSSVVGTNFWIATSAAAAVVIATNYPYAGTYPIPGPHQSALSINGTVTNLFLPSFDTNVWVDMMLQLNPAALPLAPLTNAAFAIAVAPDGHLAVWNRTNAPAAGNGWTELLDTPAGSNQFCRVTLGAAYAPDANGLFYYSVWVNGVASTNPAGRYAAADASQPWFGQIVASGNFLLDDLVVATNQPFYTILTSVTGYGGGISPAGPVVVTPGATDTFTFAPSNWYSLASVTIDGAAAGTNAACTFTNVQSDHTVVAGFAPMLAANNTPEWWLYEQNTNWATNFNAAALGDQDGDGMPTWQEYIAGTDPNNAASAFGLTAALTGGQTILSLPTIATTPQYQARRYYALEYTTNLLSASAWQAIPAWTNVLGAGQVLAYTNLSGWSHLFYRARVWLGP